MKNRILFDNEKNLIMVYSRKNRKWEDKTNDIIALYNAYYYGKHTGYNVYYKNSSGHFFYRKENILILNIIKNIPLSNQDVFADNVLIKPLQIDLFQKDFYRIKTKTSVLVTNNIEFKSGLYKNIYNYYFSLAKYAQTITKNDEPLYFLSKNYEKVKPNRNSALFKYFDGVNKYNADNDPIIVPIDFNQSQHKAIQTALENEISVIEGPPGTGKTQTIINLIANILSRNLKCAVVSNNNTAIDNVYEKLEEENIEFVAARLGSSENVETFFEEVDNEALNKVLQTLFPAYGFNTNYRIKVLSRSMKTIHEREVKESSLKIKLEHLKVEYRNFKNKGIPFINIKRMLKSKNYIDLMHKLETPGRMTWFQKLIIRFKYKVNLKKTNISDLIINLENLYYKKKIDEIEQDIKLLNHGVTPGKKENTIKELKELSKTYLLSKLQYRYKNLQTKDFDKASYKRDYNSFVKRYPVVLSTTHSLLNNMPNQFMFDYLIIDEASQGDLLSSIIAMNCAKRVVIVGDSKQLQQIDEDRLFETSQQLALEYNIPNHYRYEKNSILQSVLKAVTNIPITLLKEHYRSAPDIISFCNNMFYDGELIPMTTNSGTHIKIIKTAPGNHARRNPHGSGLYNQREIDELKIILKNKDPSTIGIITPFRYQANLIQTTFNNELLQADTIHKFQGRQKEEIILSFVANSLEKNKDNIENRLYDFLTNEELLNVAISRAQNKVIAIVSDKIYNSKNNVIKDFINYAEYLYGNSITKQSSTTSVFDFLYSEYNEILLDKFKNSPYKYKSEFLMAELIEKTLREYKHIGFQMHVRLSKIINDVSILAEKEQNYVLHPWTHVDFLFFNKVTKQRLFVLEVDGIFYHEQSEKQTKRDKIKDKILEHNDVPIFRFKTNESNEKAKLNQILKQFTY